MTTSEHVRLTPWPRNADGSIVPACSCGWQSTPCTNGEFANQAWERHARGADASNEGASSP